MNDSQAKLENLQQADIAIFKVENELGNQKVQIEQLNSGLELLREKMEGHQSKIEQQGNDRLDREKMLFIEQDRLKRTRSKLQGTNIRNPHAYNANQREIDKVKKDIEVLENELLALMESIEEEQANLEQTRRELEEKEKERAVGSGEIEKRLEALASRRDQLERERETLAKEVDSEALPIYERLHRRYPQNSVVEARSELCMGCNMRIPPQLYNELRRGEKLITCPACQRILYFRPEEGNEKMEAAS